MTGETKDDTDAIIDPVERYAGAVSDRDLERRRWQRGALGVGVEDERVVGRIGNRRARTGSGIVKLLELEPFRVE